MSVSSNRCFIYCRVSSTLQQDGISLDAQYAKCLEKLSQYNLNTSSLIQEISSVRKHIPDLLRYLSNKKNATIVFYSVDRFCRNYNNGIEVVNRIINNGGRVIFIRENIDSSVASWRTNFENYLRIAQAESDAISDRVKTAIKQYRNEGYHVGYVPYGKTSVIDIKNNKRKRLQMNQTEQFVIEFIVACRTPGIAVKFINNVLQQLTNDAKEYPIIVEINDIELTEIKHAIDYKTIADFLNQYGITYRNGNQFTAQIVQNIYKNNKNNSNMIEDDSKNNQNDHKDEKDNKEDMDYEWQPQIVWVKNKRNNSSSSSSSSSSSFSSSSSSSSSSKNDSFSMSNFSRTLRATARTSKDITEDSEDENQTEEQQETDDESDEEKPIIKRRKVNKKY